MAQADIDEGTKAGLTTTERKELVGLRRENRVLRMVASRPGEPVPPPGRGR